MIEFSIPETAIFIAGLIFAFYFGTCFASWTQDPEEKR
jgi:hypothetical protein